VLGVAEFEDLVGREGCGGEADDEVDFFAEGGVLREVVDCAFEGVRGVGVVWGVVVVVDVAHCD